MQLPFKRRCAITHLRAGSCWKSTLLLILQLFGIYTTEKVCLKWVWVYFMNIIYTMNVTSQVITNSSLRCHYAHLMPHLLFMCVRVCVCTSYSLHKRVPSMIKLKLIVTTISTGNFYKHCKHYNKYEQNQFELQITLLLCTTKGVITCIWYMHLEFSTVQPLLLHYSW